MGINKNPLFWVCYVVGGDTKLRMEKKCLLIICILTYFFHFSGVFDFSVQEVTQKTNSPYLTVKFLNVGQGDGMIVLFPNGKSLLMDGGPRESSEAVLNGLVELGIQKIDYLICTHPDIDHIGGLLDVIRSVPVGQVLDSGKGYDTRAYLEYIRLIHERNIPFMIIQEGMSLPFDTHVEVKVLNSGQGKTFNNNASIVLWMKYKACEFLFMADAEKKVEKRIIKKYHLDVDLIKVAHHGSYSSTSQKFLEAIQPTYGIISYEKGNPYGHPHQSVLKRLRKNHVKLFQTALDGDIDVKTDGENLWIEQKLMKIKKEVQSGNLGMILCHWDNLHMTKEMINFF